MNEYKTALQEQNGYRPSTGERKGIESYGITRVFIPAVAPPYPSIEEELKRDVSILKTSLDIHRDYIDMLRKAKDSLATKMDFKEMHIGILERQIESYQEFFCKTKEKEKNSDQRNF